MAFTDERNIHHIAMGRETSLIWGKQNSEDSDVALYRPAQPAPVVPDAYVRDERGRMMLNGVCEPRVSFGAGWNACRAAMLQTKPGCTCPSDDGSLRWPCPEHPDNSPVILEGYVMVSTGKNDDLVT